MTSILTNVGAISAVSQLRSIGAAQAENRQQVATGLRVATAQDNTAYWSIATTMRSDNRAFSAVEDSLGMGAAAVDVAYQGMSFAIDVVQEVKDKLVTAREAGIDRKKINGELDQLRSQLYTIVESSQFNGENWLHRRSAADDEEKEVVGSFLRDASGNVSVKTLKYTMTNALGTNHLIDEDNNNGILTNVQYAHALGTNTEWVLMNSRDHNTHTAFELNDTTTATDIDEMISVTDRMLLTMTDAAADLGAILSRIEMQKNFVVDLQDTQARGIGRLVDADLTYASSKMRAVETQGKLANQALSIANASPRNVATLLSASMR